MNLFVVFIVFGEMFGITIADIHRSKRFLIFPPTSPTRMQIIAGIGVPVQLEYESVTFGWTFKAEWFLADNTTITGHFNQDPFNPITRPITNKRRRRHAELVASNERRRTHDPIEIEESNAFDKNSTTNYDAYEKYDVEAIEIDSGLSGVDTDDDSELYGDGMYADEDVDLHDDDDTHDQDNEEENIDDDYHPEANYPQDLSTARWTIFKGMEMLAERKGLAGRPCMLRSICEAAQAPFSIKSGILGELMHVIMTPSLTKDTIVDHAQNEYLRAEEIGLSGEPCGNVFKECTMSVLDQFSGIYNTMEHLIKFFG